MIFAAGFQGTWNILFFCRVIAGFLGCQKCQMHFDMILSLIQSLSFFTPVSYLA